jgi:hypothetical protein
MDFLKNTHLLPTRYILNIKKKINYKYVSHLFIAVAKYLRKTKDGKFSWFMVLEVSGHGHLAPLFLDRKSR